MTDITNFAQNLTRLKAANVPPTTGLAPNEIIDDEITIGEDMVGWDKEIRNGRVYLTRRNNG